MPHVPGSQDRLIAGAARHVPGTPRHPTHPSHRHSGPIARAAVQVQCLCVRACVACTHDGRARAEPRRRRLRRMSSPAPTETQTTRAADMGPLSAGLGRYFGPEYHSELSARRIRTLLPAAIPTRPTPAPPSQCNPAAATRLRLQHPSRPAARFPASPASPPASQPASVAAGETGEGNCRSLPTQRRNPAAILRVLRPEASLKPLIHPLIVRACRAVGSNCHCSRAHAESVACECAGVRMGALELAHAYCTHG